MQIQSMLRDKRILTKEEEQSLFKSSDVVAIMSPYVKLVWSICKCYWPFVSENEREDLFQVGVMGLLASIKKFDVLRGVRFSIYCKYWVKMYIRIYLKKTSFFKDLTSTDFKTLKSFKKKILQAFEENNVELKEEICQQLNITESLLDEYYLFLNRKIVSFIYHKDDKEEDVLNNISDNNEVEDDYFSSEKEEYFQGIIKDIFRILSPREKEVFTMLHLKDEDEKMTLQQVGDVYGLSRQNIDQFDHRIMNKVKRYIMHNYRWNKAVALPERRR